MKYIIAIITILLIAVSCMGCVIVNKEINSYVINPNVYIESEIK